MRWGSSIGNLRLPYLKAIGIRIHFLRYQQRREIFKDESGGKNSDGKDVSYETSEKDFKRAKGMLHHGILVKIKNPKRKINAQICINVNS